MLFILVWRDLVESTQNFRKKSDKKKKDDQNKQRRITYVLVFILMVFGTGLSALRGIIPPMVTDYAANFMVVAMVLFLGMMGSPYYAYKVRKIQLNAKSKTVKAVLQKIIVISSSFAVMSTLGVVNYVSTFFQPSDSFDAKMQNYIGTHTAQSLAGFFVTYALLPKGSTIKSGSGKMPSSMRSTFSSKSVVEDTGSKKSSKKSIEKKVSPNSNDASDP